MRHRNLITREQNLITQASFKDSRYLYAINHNPYCDEQDEKPDLGHAQRRIRPSGPRTAAFVDMALRGAQNFPQHLLQTFDVDEFEHDVLLMHRLKGLRASVASLLEKLDDTIYASSADALAEANEVYGYLKKASRFEGSLKAVVKEIGQRYARPSRPKNVAGTE